MLSYLFMLLYIFRQTAATTPPYTASDFILLNCGAPGNSNDSSGRLWYSDEASRYAAVTKSSASPAFRMLPSDSSVPYQTARVFQSSYTYTFPLSPGHKFLRLYFYPDVYSDFNTSHSFFSLTANAITLLTNFSAPLHSNRSFMKEFVIRIDESQRLRLTFTPNPNSFAFVNGIEISDTLYFKGNDVPIQSNGQMYYFNNNTALENLYRLNVGGGLVDVKDDTGMYRAWFDDYDYIYYGSFGWPRSRIDAEIPYSNTAPAIVYKTARLMNELSKSMVWGFPVDSGFLYLIRLHFCEFMDNVTEPNQRVFDISLDVSLDKMVDNGIDIISLAGGPLIPIYKDYMFWVPKDGNRGKQDLLLALSIHVGDGLKHRVPLLNGIEIFKLNDTNGSLAAPNPEPVFDSTPPPPAKKTGGSSLIYPVVGSVAGALALVAVVSVLILRRRRKVKDSGTSVIKSSWVPLSIGSRSTARTSRSGVSLPSDLCRNSIIGRGGFGYVYRGVINNGATTVAIKRLNPSSNQGAREFLTEIQMLSQLKHLHLVSLIGYCDEDEEMILVYDYMANGSLRGHLYNSENPPLSWKQLLQISMGAAKGLHYLHTGAQHAIIHRDVKSTNILLDENWEAKISDFGLSKMGDTNYSFTHISTNVKGTFGYLDPKYLSTRQLTRKSDVYAFGVVLFEILSGRPAVDVRLDEEQHSLAGWARFCVREGEVDQLIDPNLVGQISAACLKVYVGIAGRSIHIQPLERPTMADVVMGLELALALQDSSYSAQHKEEDAVRISSDPSEVVVSLDDISYSKGEVDRIISQDYPSSSTRNNQVKAESEEWKNHKAEEDSSD